MTASHEPRLAEGVETVSEERQHELIKAYDQESNFRRLAATASTSRHASSRYGASRAA